MTTPEPLAAHLHQLRLEGLSPGWVYARARAITRMTAAISNPLLGATEADLRAWRESVAHLTPDALAHYIRHAQGYFGWAAAQGIITSDPAAGLPVPRVPRRLPRPISEEDLVLALETAPSRIRPWIVLAAWCGLRAKEIALLRRDCIRETARPPVLIVAADATKGSRERAIPLSPFVRGELAAAELAPAGYAFRRRDGRRGPNTPCKVSHLVNGHLHAQGIAASLHTLRHRFATGTYATSGYDLLLVQALLGHADVASTTIYVDYNRAGAAEAVAALPAPRRLRAVRAGESI